MTAPKKFSVSQLTAFTSTLFKAAGMVASVSEGNRAIDQGGARVDGEVVKDRAFKLPAGEYVLQVGKRRFTKATLVVG